MSAYPTVVSFYTDDWEYPQYAEKLKQDCSRLGLRKYIIRKEDSGGWLANTRLKPIFILESLMRLREPLLWIDVDGSLLKMPELLQSGHGIDIAIRPKPKGRSRKWHVGTMYFNYTSATIGFLQEWCEHIKGHKESDEVSLNQMWAEDNPVFKELRICELPPEYFQMLRASQPEPLRKTVIAHRASKGKSKAEFMKKQSLNWD
jgi:hypothetical protein